VTDPYVRILGFLDRSRYFSFKQLLSCTHEAEWTTFQTHYLLENLVAPGIEPGPLATRPQRRGAVYWILLAKNKDRCMALVILLVLRTAVKISSSCAAGDFARNTQLD
jgi:hypothetical protein